jgi:hypothetical protein
MASAAACLTPSEQLSSLIQCQTNKEKNNLNKYQQISKNNHH